MNWTTKAILHCTFALLTICGCQDKHPPDNSKMPSEIITISNESVILKCNLKIGRIIWYSHIGSKNLMWINPDISEDIKKQRWVNHGGDKVWIAPGSSWPINETGKKIPDPSTDGKPWILLSKTNLKIVMQSSVSQKFGVELTRTIELKNDSSEVVISHTLNKKNESIHPTHIWTVSQLIEPEYGLIGIADGQTEPYFKSLTRRPLPKECVIVDPSNKAARFDNYPPKDPKVGSLGKWVAAIYPQYIFLQSGPLYINSQYADNANCELYFSNHFKYMELELLSPLTKMKKGQSINFEVHWKLIPKNSNTTQAKVIQLINEAISRNK